MSYSSEVLSHRLLSTSAALLISKASLLVFGIVLQAFYNVSSLLPCFLFFFLLQLIPEILVQVLFRIVTRENSPGTLASLGPGGAGSVRQDAWITSLLRTRRKEVIHKDADAQLRLWFPLAILITGMWFVLIPQKGRLSL